jgi:hypothetical protein
LGPNQDIADKLGISKRTVDTHWNHIYGKLGVHTPIQAVGRAVELGYLEINAIESLRGVAAPSFGRNYKRFHALCDQAGDLDHALERAGLLPLAEFGLFLLTVCNLAARNISRYYDPQTHRGLVCELNDRGEILHSFGDAHMNRAFCIVEAPPSAKRKGFTPGHLFVTADYVPQRNLNRGAIAEFTPDGRFARSFCGGPEVGIRLVGPLKLGFAPTGDLLATSGLLTDAILAFEAGGKRVRRFIEGYHEEICVSPQGEIYALRASGHGKVMAVYDGEGRFLRELPNPPNAREPHSIAVSPQDRVFLTRDEELPFREKPPRAIEECDADGNLIRRLPLSGFNRGTLALDGEGRLYVTCPEDETLTILSPDGEVARRIEFGGRIMPWDVCVSASGRIWVCGEKPANEE